MTADIRPYDPSPEGLDELASLLRAALPRATYFDRAYLDWTYRGNPDGPAIALNAYAGRLVAHFAATAFRARHHGVEELGVQPQHAVTDPGHRGRGLFVSLVGMVLERAAAAGYRFAVMPANAASFPLFVQRLGFRPVRPLDVRVGVGPLPQPRDEPAVGLDFERVWSAEALAWRLARPDLPYRALRGRDRARIFSTSVAGIPVELGSYPLAHVPESLPAASPWHPLRAWIGLDPRRRWWGRPFVNVPLRLRPAPLHLVFRDLTDAGRRLDPDRVRADMLDYDQF